MTGRIIRAHFDAERRRVLRHSATLALGAAINGIAPVFAQGYPSRAIRIVVPWGPGGLVDIGGRVVGDTLQKAFDQATAVENVPGAAGTLCLKQSGAQAAGGSQTSAVYGQFIKKTFNSGPYYRVTVRVTGPRSTTSYVQALVY